MNKLNNLLSESKEDSKNLAILIDPAVHARLKAFASSKQLRMSKIVEAIITDTLDTLESASVADEAAEPVTA